MYMAPEIWNAKTTPFDPRKADIFSLGVVFFYLAFGAPAFSLTKNTDTYFRFIVNKPGSLDFFKGHPSTRIMNRENEIPEEFKKLII